MDTTHSEEGEPRAGDLLIGAARIKAYLIELGMPEETDPYYLKRRKTWPIGKTAEGKGASLIASKRRLARHADRLTRGSA
ncbi:MAG: hypothetical protein WAN75_14815 [Xanthobacteraceae bacterium]|jgi:hypothetical protein